MKEKIKKLAKEYLSDIIEIRRHLHKYPELSFQESETAKYISSILDKWKIEHQSGIAGNGIVAIVKGKNPTQKIIALRADLDALPIVEENEISYKSCNKGIMHACGHDAHTASLLGVIKIANDLKDEFEGTLKFIFQPAEEKLPGGAKQMIEEGVLTNDPVPELIVGQHVYPELKSGTVGFKPGAYMASTDEIYLTIKGKGGHAALPHKTTNTVLIAAQILVELQKITNVLAPKEIPTVLAFGKVIANGATNVIPNEVYIEGTFRTMNEKWRKEVHNHIRKIAKDVATSMGGDVDIDIKIGYPVLFNNEQLTQKAIAFSDEYLGHENVQELDFRMTAEDFAYFSQEIPAVFYRLGTSNPENNEYFPLHSPNFNIHEDSLETGMGTMAYIALNLLNN